MKICFIHQEDIRQTFTATEPYFISNYLSEDHRVYFIIPVDEGKIDTALKNQSSKVNFIEIKFWGFSFFSLLKYNFLALKKVWELHRKNQLDIIYSYHYNILVGFIMKLFTSVKWVSDFRILPIEQDLEFMALKGNQSLMKKFLIRINALSYRFLLKKCDLIIAITSQIKEILIKNYKLLNKDFYLQPLGVDLSEFRSEFVDPPTISNCQLVYLGSITNFRGIDTILKAVSILKKDILGIRLTLIGTGPDKDMAELKKLSKDLRIDKLVYFMGKIPRHDIPDKLRKFHLALSPLPALKSYIASSPSKVFEYLALAKVVIASDILAHQNIIESGKNGFLFKPDDHQSLADQIKFLIKNPSVYQKVQQSAPKSVEEYDWAKMVSKLEKELLLLIKEH